MRPRLRNLESKSRLILTVLKDLGQRREIKGTNTLLSVLDKIVICATFPCLRENSTCSLVVMRSTETVYLISCAMTITNPRMTWSKGWDKKPKINWMRLTKLVVWVVKFKRHQMTLSKAVTHRRRKDYSMVFLTRSAQKTRLMLKELLVKKLICSTPKTMKRKYEHS